MAFLRTKDDLFFSKKDSSDPRLGDLAQKIETIKDFADVSVIAGYPDDEGIKRNGGRVGARDAPSAIRKNFYKMTPPLLSSTTPKITDVGDLDIEGSLEERQARAIAEAKKYLEKGAKWIGLGGGHDWGFVDGTAFLDTFKENPLVINFDAHMDVRPMPNGANSGTPFFQLLSRGEPFEFLEIGLQSHCNSKAHLAWLKEKGGRCLFYDELLHTTQTQSEKILNFLEEPIKRRRKTYLTIDIDAFSNAWAPGCSQSFATGLNPDDFFRVLEVLKTRLDVRVFGIYEVSPSLDTDDRTSKLAAQILHKFI
jgi:formiminoglutamase